MLVSSYLPLLYDDGMTNFEAQCANPRFNPPSGDIKPLYRAAVYLPLMIGGVIAGDSWLYGPIRMLAGASAGYGFARGLFWLRYYLIEGKKRPWQFDLRSAFFVMTLAAVLLGIVAVLLNEGP